MLMRLIHVSRAWQSFLLSIQFGCCISWWIGKLGKIQTWQQVIVDVLPLEVITANASVRGMCW